MLRIYVENQPFDIPQHGKSLLEVCLSLGFNVPYFCWHPAFHSVGACRQCAVRVYHDEADTRGKLVMSCMIQPQEGMRVAIDDAEAVDFRRKVIEWLMINHPHDCPVCDEGGECHLQDMTVMAGHVYRRTRFPKRTFRNQYLGPLVNHEMNRCIHCYRCVRFYREYAGGRDFDVMGCHDNTYFGRHADGTLESEFAGNLVEVCPTGVFTDKTLKKHFTRKWDLQTAPSICVHCGLGCNTIPGERYGKLRRIRARFHGQVNGYFLCDRGRYGYEFVNSDRRIRQPLLRGADGQLHPVSAGEALRRAGEMLAGGKPLGVGSGRASLESNFALLQLVGQQRYVHGMAEGHHRLVRLILDILRTGPVPAASLQEADGSDAVFILGEDVTNTAPMLALALRQAVLEKPIMDAARRQQVPDWEDAVLREAIQQEKGPFFVATPDATKLDDLATTLYRAAPADLARLGLAVAHAVDAHAPAVLDLPEGVETLATWIAQCLARGDRPLVVSGITCGSEDLLRAAANVAWAMRKSHPKTKLCFTVPECNSLGLALLPGVNVEQGRPALRDPQVGALLVVENDLYRQYGSVAAGELIAAARHLIVIDSIQTPTTLKADLVLPAATFAEANGTLVNNEGRAQRFYQVFPPEGDVRESWRWVGELLAVSPPVTHGGPTSVVSTPASQATPSSGTSPPVNHGGANPWKRWDDITAAIVEALPSLKGIAAIAPPADFRMFGQRVPRQPHRYSGRTAMTANLDVREPQPAQDADTPLAFSMEGTDLQPPSALVSRVWAPGWNSCQAVNKFQIEVGGPLHMGDPGVRLIRPSEPPGRGYYPDLPEAFSRREDQWLIVPAYHVFGSEELSVLAPGIAELSPGAYLAINPADAKRLGLAEGQQVACGACPDCPGLPVVFHPALPEGVAAMPVGLPDACGLALPAWEALRPVARQEL